MKKGKKMEKIFSLLMVLTLAVGISACGSGTTGKEENAGESASRDDVIFSISSDTTSLDPAETKDTVSYLVIFQMFDTLVREEPDGTIAPALAESWEWNDDNTEPVSYTHLDVYKRQGPGREFPRPGRPPWWRHTRYCGCCRCRRAESCGRQQKIPL